jgi:pimeloyl-ACP methyl ester carboxylesterase
MKQLLLLHGAIGAKDQLTDLEGVLKSSFNTHAINFSGHGGREFPVEQFSIPLFAKNVLAFLDEKNIERINIFGYSMGGYVAMYLAKHFPERIDKVITLATKFYWDEATAAKEVKMLNAETIQQKIPAFAEQLQQRHSPNDWKEVLDRTKQLLLQLGESNTLQSEDYSTITTPSLLLLGDRDKMVTLDETVAVYKKLPAGELGILPNTPHPIEQTDVILLAEIIKRFLQ